MSGKNKAMAVAAVASVALLSGCIADDNDNYEKAERYNFQISPMGFAPVEYAAEYHPYADDHQKWQKENFSNGKSDERGLQRAK